MPTIRHRALTLLICSLVVSSALPEAAAPDPAPIADPPPRPASIRESIDRGIQFMLTAQNPNGSWGSARHTKDLNIYAPVPGAHHAFQTATTALGIAALIETGGDRPEVIDALTRAEAWLFRELPRLRRANATALYNVWGHAYSIQALVRIHNRHPDDPKRQKQARELILSQFDYLTRYESVDGGWGYYDFDYGTKKPASDTTSFTSAAALVALHEAQEIGIKPPRRIVDRALASIRRQQKPDGSFLYGEYLRWRPMMGVNRPGGSLGRSQACHLALRLWGDKAVTDAVIVEWLDRLVARNGWLDIGRKRPVPHESWFQVAGYFFYFGHYYAALCIDQLPVDQRPDHAQKLAQILLDLQEKDGSWWDYPLYDYHQPYGTAFALMSLQHCLPGSD